MPKFYIQLIFGLCILLSFISSDVLLLTSVLSMMYFFKILIIIIIIISFISLTTVNF